jgi:hypothetical protein
LKTVKVFQYEHRQRDHTSAKRQVYDGDERDIRTAHAPIIGDIPMFRKPKYKKMKEANKDAENKADNS